MNSLINDLDNLSKPEDEDEEDVIKPAEKAVIQSKETTQFEEENKNANAECIICCQELSDNVNKKKKKQGYF